MSTSPAPPAADLDSGHNTMAAWGWAAALLGWSLLLGLYQLDAPAYFEQSDAWVAQTAREMVEQVRANGLEGLITPQFSGEVRTAKSPGPYWAVCLAAWATGGEVTEFAVRLPNALGLVLLTMTCFWMVTSIAGLRAGVFAGFVACGTIGSLVWSHRASGDPALAALMAASLACLWHASEEERPAPRAWLWLSGYLLAGLAMLYKIPVPIIFIGLPLVLYVVLCNRWRALGSIWHLVGLVLFCLPWLPWTVAIVRRYPIILDRWRVEFVDRGTGALPNLSDQPDAWWYYLLYVGLALALTFPFSLSVFGALAVPFRRTERDRARRGRWFLWLWFIGLLGFLTVYSGKETRYFIPALPPLLMLLGIELSRFFDPRRAGNPRLRGVALAAVVLLVPAMLFGLHKGLDKLYERTEMVTLFPWEQLWRPALVAGIVLGVGAVIAAGLFFRRRTNASFGALVVTTWLVFAWIWPNLIPRLEHQGPYRAIASQLREKLTPEQHDWLVSIAHQDPRVIWYSDLRFPRLISQLDMLAMQDGRRDPLFERRKYGQEMLARLRQDEPVLMVADIMQYALFRHIAEKELAARGEEMPPIHVWLTSGVGRLDHRHVVFGNRPPDWEPPALGFTERQRQGLARRADELSARLASDETPLVPTSGPSGSP